MKAYPSIGRIENHSKNTCAKCKCGEIGKAKVHIEVNWFRGDDEVKWTCMDHIKDPEYLLGALAEGEGK